MTTTINPSIGHGPWTQSGVGSSPGYDAQDLRRSVTGYERGEGVSTYDSFRVSQRGAGANLSVDVNQDQMAFVRGDAVAQQQIYDVAPHVSTINETITTADVSNPRIDRVVLQVLDTAHDASGSSLAQTRVIAGTPTSGATLDNLNGAGSVPNSALLLADVLVAAGDTSISNSEIRDRRAFVTGIPPLLSDLDMVALSSPLPTSFQNSATSVSNNRQVAGLVSVPRRIVGATRIRWAYQQSASPQTGTWAIALFDASGRLAVSTGAVSFTGLASTFQYVSATISATTFEPGMYYELFGYSLTGSMVWYDGFGGPVTGGTEGHHNIAPNMFAYVTSGGTTVPTTLLGFTDMATTPVQQVPIPRIALSVG